MKAVVLCRPKVGVAETKDDVKIVEFIQMNDSLSFNPDSGIIDYKYILCVNCERTTL